MKQFITPTPGIVTKTWYKQKSSLMNILIADDHELIRGGIKRLLSDSFEHLQFGEATNGPEVFEFIEKKSWDILILDLNLSGQSGLEVLKELKRRESKVPVLVLSMYPEEQFAVRVIKAGAAGYATKGGSTSDLVDAVKKIASGGKYITSSVAEKLIDAVDAGLDQTPDSVLSDREFEIFKLIASGKTVGEIARMLNRSVKTISTHRAHILQKMNLENNASIMQYAVSHKLGE